MSQIPTPDPFLSQPSQPQATPFSQRGQSQYRMRIPPPRPLSQELTQYDTRAIEQREQQRQADADAAAAAADRARQEEDDALTAAYDAQEAAYAAYLAENPSYEPYDFSRPLTPPPGYRPFSEEERAIEERVQSADRPVQRPYIFYGSQSHAAAAAEQHERNKEIARQFIIETNKARREAEAKLKKQGQGQGQGGIAKSKKGGQKMLSKKKASKPHSKSKYTRKSNKKKMHRKKSQRRN